MRIFDGIIQGNGQENNVEKRRHSGVLACNVFGPIAVPPSTPSFPSAIDAGTPGKKISQVTKLHIAKRGHVPSGEVSEKGRNFTNTFNTNQSARVQRILRDGSDPTISFGHNSCDIIWSLHNVLYSSLALWCLGLYSTLKSRKLSHSCETWSLYLPVMCWSHFFLQSFCSFCWCGAQRIGPTSRSVSWSLEISAGALVCSITPCLVQTRVFRSILLGLEVRMLRNTRGVGWGWRRGGGVLGPSYGLGSKAIPFFRINFLPFPD